MKKMLLAVLMSFFLINLVQAVSLDIGGRPANPDPKIEHSDSWFIYTLSPGESKNDELLLQNRSNKTATVIIYGADTAKSGDGAFALKQQKEEAKDVGKWITLSQTEIILNPGEQKRIPFTITVPKDPSIDVGEHLGGIMIEAAPLQEKAKNTAKQGTQEVKKGDTGISITFRTGVRVYVTIPGEVVKKMTIEKFEVQPDFSSPKTYIAKTTIQNSSNVSQDVVVKTKISATPTLLDIFAKDDLAKFPLEDEHTYQALPHTPFTTSFQFPKPLFGQLKVETSVLYDNKSKTLTTDPIIVNAFDMNTLLLPLLLLILLVGIVVIIILRKHHKKHGHEKHKDHHHLFHHDEHNHGHHQ